MTAPTTTVPRTLFIGESPPRGAPADFRPFDCDSGLFFARAVGFTSKDIFLDHCARTNIFPVPTAVPDAQKWDNDEAARRGAQLIVAHRDRIAAPPDASYMSVGTAVAIGRRTVAALGLPDLPAHAWAPHAEVHVLALPHPSGRSRSLKDEHSRSEYRRAVLPELVAGCPTLRPWHFALDQPPVLADLGAALCPLDHALGAAVAIVAAEMHRAKAVSDKYNSDEYRATFDVPLLTLTHLRTLDDVRTFADALPTLPTRAVTSAVKARAVFADRTVPPPPSEYRRALVGRYVALRVW